MVITVLFSFGFFLEDSDYEIIVVFPGQYLLRSQTFSDVAAGSDASSDLSVV